MKFDLTHSQYIGLGKHYVYFCHNAFYSVALNRQQFYNLHDILQTEMLLKAYPLGKGTWLMKSDGTLRIQSPTHYFHFHRKSLKKYIKHIHPRIHFIFRHGECAYREHDANYEGYHADQPRGTSSRMRWKITSRSARNARAAYFNRKKHSNVQKRHGANSRSYSPDHSQYHVSRTHETNLPETLPDNDIECGDECSVEEETFSFVNSV